MADESSKPDSASPEQVQEIIEKAPWTGGAEAKDKPVLRYADVLSDSLRVGFSGYFPIAITAALIGFVYQYFFSFPLLATDSLTTAAAPLNTMVSSAADIWLNFVLIALFISYGVSRFHKDGQSFLASFSRFGRSLVVLIPLSVIFTLCVGVGMVLLVVPGMILFLMWFALAPALIVEGRGFESLGRSAELTDQYRWKIFLLNLTVTVGSFLVAMLIGLVSGFISPEIAGAMFTAVDGLRLTYSATIAIVMAAIMPFYVGLSASVYGHLTRIKEGGAPESLRKVFE